MSSPTASSASRRVRALAHLVPILLLERDRNAGAAGRDWSCYDPKLLTIRCIDRLVASAGLEGHDGVPRDELERDLAEAAARSAPQRPTAEHADVATWLLDRLLAAGTGSRTHPVDWTDPDDFTSRTERVRLLYETLAEDDTVLVCYDDPAVHLLLIGLDVNIEDAQVAVGAVLAHQMSSGRLDEAVASAEHALQLTRQYRSQLRGFVTTARRDLTSLDWGTVVEPHLARALGHVEARLGADTTLYSHADEARSSLDADPDQAAASARVVDLLRQSIDTLTRLQRDLIEARDVFLAEQARQLFTSAAPLDTVDLPARVLDPLLAVPLGGDAVLDVGARLLPPRSPAVFTTACFDDLLRPAARPDPDVEPQPEGTLADVDAVIAGLTNHHYAALDVVLDAHAGRTVRLSSLLADLPHEDPVFSHEMSLLCALVALQGFTGDGAPVGRVASDDDGAVLHDRTLRMPDLLLSVEPR